MQPLQRRHNKVRERRLQVSTSVSSWLNFTPLQFAPSLWLDASDTATITESSGDVSQWNDKSGNGLNFAQGNAAAQPKTGTRTVNNLNAIDFDGSNDILSRNSTSVVSQTDGMYTIFAVVSLDVTTGTQSVFNGDIGGPRPPQFLRFGGTTLESIRVNTFANTISVATASVASAVTSNTPALIRARLAAGSFQVFSDWIAGTELGTTGGADARATRHDVGAASSAAGNNFMNGLICEIIVYNYAMTRPQMNSVERYLRSKWGLV